MEKEIKVYLYANENDDYNELWKVVDEEKYYARHTFNNGGIWYYVCDPLGYCELDYKVADDVTFILCDSEGNEYYRYSNGEPNPLPKFEDYIKLQWDKVKRNYTHNVENNEANFWTMCISGETVRKLDKWLISFMDKDIYPNEIKEMHGYPENWCNCWHNKETEYTVIPDSKFTYLGEKYQFYKVHHKHDICGVEWDTYECGYDPLTLNPFGTEEHPLIETKMEMGTYFDESIIGTMYDTLTARNKVIDKLLELFPKEKSRYNSLIYVVPKKEDSWFSTDVCYVRNYEDVAKMLIDNDYHKASIEHLIKNLTEKIKDIVFDYNMDNMTKVEEKYPGIYVYDFYL